MKLLIVSTAPFIFKEEKCFAYSPYVTELVIWNKYADTITFCCPVWESERGLLVSKLPFEIHKHFKLVEFNLNSVINIAKTFFSVFYNIFILLKAMRQADHIHLRCPGNIGLLGCLIQILFPRKPKTAKYAGNWDPKAKQPWSYRLQKWILSNPFLTRNIQVLVYGEWEGSTKNIKSFFTATYSEKEKLPLQSLDLKGNISFVFVGTLVQGKNPLYAIQLIETMLNKGCQVSLDLYGEGILRSPLEAYIQSRKLESAIKLRGNHTPEVIKEAYQKSHFVLLPSKSEGWPKAVAEGMFWGCVPISTSVSCVPYMLGHGERGLLLQMDLEQDVQQIALLLQDQMAFQDKREAALHWSRQYTTDVFEQEIKRIVKN
jgi:glycosyltransferase involved in cell wall biosynthesis